jgi:predicted NAD/FAD-binding protein
VTLNCNESIAPEKIIRRLVYDHPLYTPAGVAAQQRKHEIDGVNRSVFCGAYWRNGFHEDGVVSAIKALEHFENTHNAQRDLSRVA